VLAVVLLGVVAAGGVASSASVRRPLVHGSVGDTTDEAPYEDRTLVHRLLSLRNEGRFDVRVERVGAAPEVDPESAWHGLVAVRPDQNVLNPPNVHARSGPPFQPFTLAPGEERTVAVALWLDNCEHNAPGSSMAVTEVPVRFRALGLTRTTEISLSTPWGVTVPRSYECPRPPVR
jgi:hypothetical protein